MTIRDNTIHLTNVKDSDKVIRNVKGSTLSLHIDGEVSLTLRGSHENFDSIQAYPIAIVNMSTLEKNTIVSEAGLYLAIIDGLDEIVLDMSGTGIIHWKELGD